MEDIEDDEDNTTQSTRTTLFRIGPVEAIDWSDSNEEENSAEACHAAAKGSYFAFPFISVSDAIGEFSSETEESVEENMVRMRALNHLVHLQSPSPPVEERTGMVAMPPVAQSSMSASFTSAHCKSRSSNSAEKIKIFLAIC
jgi:hypothetical protein